MPQDSQANSNKPTVTISELIQKKKYMYANKWNHDKTTATILLPSLMLSVMIAAAKEDDQTNNDNDKCTYNYHGIYLQCRTFR